MSKPVTTESNNAEEVMNESEKRSEALDRLIKAARNSMAKVDAAIKDKSATNLEREKRFLETFEEDLLLVESTDYAPHEQLPLNEARADVKEKIQQADTLLAFCEANVSKPANNPVQSTEHDVVKLTWRPIPFYGEAREWLNFWPMFKVSVHENMRYGLESKMKCLSDCLKGEAKDVFRTLQQTPSNYQKIIDLLISKYNEPNALQSMYSAELENLEPGTDEKSCRNAYLKIRSLMANLDSIKDKIVIDQAYIKKIITTKFPQELIKAAIRDVFATKKTFGYSIDELLTAIDNLITIDEYVTLQVNGLPQNNRFNEKETTSLAVSTESRKRPNTERPNSSKAKKDTSCVFCNRPHRSGDCRTYPTTQARRNRLQELKRCYNCTGPNHDAKICRIPQARCWHCQGGHLSLLCSNPSGKSRPDQTKKQNRPDNDRKSETTVLLQTFSCSISNTKSPSIRVPVRGIFDPGSQSSFVAEDLVSDLDLTIKRQILLKCNRLNENLPLCQTSLEVTAILYNETGSTIKCDFYSIPDIVRQPTTSNLSSLKNLLPELKYADRDLFSNRKHEIQLLIGTDLYYNFVNPYLTYLCKKGFAILNSTFGYIPTGSWNSKLDLKSTTPVTAGGMVTRNIKTTVLSNITEIEPKSKETEDQSNNLTRLWDLESLGIESPEKHKIVDLVVNQFHGTKYRDEEGRYVVRFPWKSDRIKLDSNYHIARARLKSLIENSSSEMKQRISLYFEELLQLGIIERAPPPKSKLIANEQNKPRTHYLPYKAILQKGKLRVVQDASAKTKTGISFNDAVHPGPNLIQSSIIIIINFRIREIGLSADIEKAFLQIVLNLLDRDATRFIWVNDPELPLNPENLIYLRFTRIFFGANASPFLLNMVIQDLLSQPPIIPILIRILKKFYVDNFVHSVKSPQEAIAIFNALTKRMDSAKFNLRDWVTNDPTVARAIPSTAQKTWPDAHNRVISVLGLMWNVDEDSLCCQINEDLPNICTKHSLLRYLASIYDPLGLWAHCTLDLKVLLQECWKIKFQWHQELPPQLRSNWERIRSALNEIPNYSIPRKLWENTSNGEFSLHVFCDASKKAYACCAYLVHENTDTHETTGSLIYAKTRLAPKKLSEKAEREENRDFDVRETDTLTIPRLELMAAIIGKRCAEFLQPNLDVTLKTTVLWTDATTVLQWLNSSEVLQPFVQNRIEELRKMKNVTIKHVPTDENPADYATRGKTPSNLIESSLWWKGPEWLGYPSLWPLPPTNVQTYVASPTLIDTTSLIIEAQPITIWLTDDLEKRFSSWDRLINVYYYRLKFIYTITKRPFPTTSMEGKRLAERLLITDIQQKYLYQHRKILLKGGRPLTNLDLFIDDNNLIRCQGRLGHSQFPWEVKHPILLPNKSFAVDLLIDKIHREDHHVGASHVLSKLRERFWVVKGRAKVKSIIHRCLDCRRWQGGSYKLPPMPALPEIRLNALAAFVHVGADYFGPLHCLNSNQEKIDVHVLLFTCLVTRAIHLELVPDLTGKQCFLALQRFSALRRVPQIIITDNATTFTFVQPMVGDKVKITDFQVNRFVDNNRIAWYFIPQYAPWFGGAYERLNALVKNSLKRTYGKKLLDYDELRTVLTLIADITNSRPLTYVSSDDPVQILTPNHFLKLGPTNINVDIGEPIANSIRTETGRDLKRNFETIARILDGYWDAFKNLYLLSLREVHQTHHKAIKGQSKFKPSVGDVVLVHEAGQPRANWSYGRIERLDRRQALAHIRTRGQIFLRSILHLYPLEVVRSNEQPVPPTANTQDEPVPEASNIQDEPVPSTSGINRIQPVQQTANNEPVLSTSDDSD